MRRTALWLMAAGTCAVGFSAAARAQTPCVIQPGQVGPNFTKTERDGPVRNLYDYAGKVIILFELGYS